MKSNNDTQPSFRNRLIAFLVVLAIGFVAGWLNGNNLSGETDLTTSGIVASSQGGGNESNEGDGQDSGTVGEAQTQTTEGGDAGSTTVAPTHGPTVEEDGWYTSKEEVALYIHTYHRLPGNFISKTKARARGWVASEGNLDEVCPGMSIGGSRFYDDDGKLPDASRRRWTECDINYHGGFRGPERIVFSNDGLIFYTADHYETFEQLY